MSKLSKSEINDYKLNNVTRLVLYLAFIVIGLVLYNRNYIKFSTIEKALGVAFIITGSIYVWMSSREKKIFLSNWDVIFGILAAVTGLLVIINPGNLVNSLTIYYGIFIVICALQKLVVAIKLYKAKDSTALLTLLTSLLLIFLGAIVFFGPYNTMNITEQCGLFAIFFGVLEFANTVLLNDREKDIVKVKK